MSKAKEVLETLNELNRSQTRFTGDDVKEVDFDGWVYLDSPDGDPIFKLKDRQSSKGKALADKLFKAREVERKGDKWFLDGKDISKELDESLKERFDDDWVDAADKVEDLGDAIYAATENEGGDKKDIKALNKVFNELSNLVDKLKAEQESKS